MEYYEIHTEENGKRIKLGIYSVYAHSEEEATMITVEKILDDFRSMRYRTEYQRYNEFTIIHVWYNDTDAESHEIVVWASEIKA